MSDYPKTFFLGHRFWLACIEFSLCLANVVLLILGIATLPGYYSGLQSMAYEIGLIVATGGFVMVVAVMGASALAGDQYHPTGFVFLMIGAALNAIYGALQFCTWFIMEKDKAQCRLKTLVNASLLVACSFVMLIDSYTVYLHYNYY